MSICVGEVAALVHDPLEVLDFSTCGPSLLQELETIELCNSLPQDTHVGVGAYCDKCNQGIHRRVILTAVPRPWLPSGVVLLARNRWAFAWVVQCSQVLGGAPMRVSYLARDEESV